VGEDVGAFVVGEAVGVAVGEDVGAAVAEDVGACSLQMQSEGPPESVPHARLLEYALNCSQPLPAFRMMQPEGRPTHSARVDWALHTFHAVLSKPSFAAASSHSATVPMFAYPEDAHVPALTRTYVGAFVGAVGACVGEDVGAFVVGEAVGVAVGEDVGAAVGEAVGVALGEDVAAGFRYDNQPPLGVTSFSLWAVMQNWGRPPQASVAPSWQQ
jgi:hypothetical protein